MLNLSRFEQIARRLHIRDRETGDIRPLIFRPPQQKILKACYDLQAKRRPLWLIFLKARRLGISTFMVALLIVHCLQRRSAKARIIAQLTDTSKELFQMGLGFTKDLPVTLPTPTQHTLYFPHGDNDKYTSFLSRATAKTVIGSRGLTHSALHLTEAAFYPGEDSFVALLNTVNEKDPNNIVAIETTANGMEGPGEAYYNYWNAAVRGDNQFAPIFLPWYDDPECILPNGMAPDAPADDYEKWLMKEFHLTAGHIAWYRTILETKCGGSIYKWKQEYPATPEEAFISSGNPAFDSDEISWARKFNTKPISRGTIRLTRQDKQGEPIYSEGDGNLLIWEFPISGDHYYIGVDAAKGVETGDFACAVGWNAETGQQAFRFASKVAPEVFAPMVFALLKWYGNAMVNIELTGGWGYLVMKELRDTFHYGLQYGWKGSRDDKSDGRAAGKTINWETTDRSRRMIFDAFRMAVRRHEVQIRDEALVAQMSRATMELEWRWTVLHGHDDILMAALLGYIALKHYHYPHGPAEGRKGSVMPKEEEKIDGISWMSDPYSTASGVMAVEGSHHLEKVLRSKPKTNALEGI